MKPDTRSHDEIKLHHEFIKTSLFISAVDLITICSTKIIKRFKNRKIYSHDSNVHLDRIYAKKYIGIGLYANSKNFRIYVDTWYEGFRMRKFKARFLVNNPNHNKLAS